MGDNSSDLVSLSLANGGSNTTMADHVILRHKIIFGEMLSNLLVFVYREIKNNV